MSEHGATATLEPGQNGSTLKVGGDWRLESDAPVWEDLAKKNPQGDIHVVAEDLGKWDSSLILFLTRAGRWGAEHQAKLDLETAPPALRTMVQQALVERPVPPEKPEKNFGWLLESLGNWAKKTGDSAVEILRFIGDCTLSLIHAARNPARFRWRDCVAEMQQCGVGALPIVSLISFLVGVIMAFQAAIQLRQFGADILVADLVGLVVVREMGPMMAAIMLTGRTGAAFAAQIGNMKVREEVDALETLGISPVDFLVLPRLVALGAMMPLLTIYANVLGILGGLFIASTMLDIPALTYWIQTKQQLGLLDIASGLIKSICFGMLVGLAGCLRGLQCGRGSGGVGMATTSAVVTGILLIIVSDAIFAVVFDILGI